MFKFMPHMLAPPLIPDPVLVQGEALQIDPSGFLKDEPEHVKVDQAFQLLKDAKVWVKHFNVSHSAQEFPEVTLELAVGSPLAYKAIHDAVNKMQGW